MADKVSEFLASLAAGRACLHPTDTLPGLTFDPRREGGLEAVAAFKGRAAAKPFLGLVATLAQARRFFAPLPPVWDAALARLWPGPLSVIWTASAEAPRALVAKDGTIGLRVPLLAAEASWFLKVLERSDVPLPTTSVNQVGKPPLTDWTEATRAVAGRENCYAPSDPDVAAATPGLPSTVIRIHGDGTYTLVRSGAVPPDTVSTAVLVF